MFAGLTQVVDRPGRDARGDRLRRHRLRRPTCSRSRSSRREHRRDRRAHDDREALLRRRRRHLRHRRAGHQGPVHAERRHQELPPVEPVLGRQRHAAAGDGRPVRRAGHASTPTSRSRPSSRPKFSYGCAVFLDSDRVNFQKEGYAKEELLAGPRAGAAEEHLAVRRADPAHGRARARSSCSRAARSTTSPRSRRRSTTSRSAFPTPRSTSTRTPARPARSAPRWRRCAWSSAAATRTFIGLDAGDRPRRTQSTNDEETRCNFCPNNCSRTFIDTKTLDGNTARYISGFSCEKGTVEYKDALIDAQQGAQEADEAVPEPGRLRGEASRSSASTSRRRCPSTARRSTTSRSRSARCSASRRTSRSSAPFQRSRREAWAKRARRPHRHPAVLNIWSTGPFWRTYFEALGIESQQRRVLRRDLRGDVAGGRQVRLGRSLLPVEGLPGAHPQPAVQAPRAKKPLNYIFFPCDHARPTFIVKQMDTASCPVVAGTPEGHPAAFTKETDFFAERGISYLDTAVTLHRAADVQAADVRASGARCSASPRTRATSRSTRRSRRCEAFEDEMEAQGHARSSTRSSARTASRS